MGGSIYLVAAVPWAILAPMNLIKLLLNKARLHTPQTQPPDAWRATAQPRFRR